MKSTSTAQNSEPPPRPASANAPSAASRTAPAILTARRVLEAEAAALRDLAGGLDEAFSAAVDLLADRPGKVIVSGMGKSGHVAKKIAATLASTGTPAFFVHPAEASHGDLGMIGRGDAVIALSNSGETPELADLVAYTRRFGLALVSITGRAPSTLSDAADVALVLPGLEEACPHGLAPTTSTTAMMALGDALAVALLERRGFTASDFRVFHPGGQLGRKLLKVSDLMRAAGELPLVTGAEPMSEVILTMSAKNLGCAGVVDGDGVLLGIITDGDLRRHMENRLLSLSAGEVMTGAPKTIPAGVLAMEALRLMNQSSITGLFAVDDEGRPMGFLHLHDCLRAGLA
ncbi:MAG: KpsF/GutQ family sugar-phosphate isomerase [Rhodospirillum sp.]|nr:KpsF/GutQ family sugar-phosphate isomerase [Rhodospirillum sp.]MCF8487546.1 KpsF/GutQ family sugar-phosphate isomerase [Rhodospirillum sp.]MCF8499029.1 KpsF/GutQ family sugar-phosphate isomerase [Rhodospirillum sp.]